MAMTRATRPGSPTQAPSRARTVGRWAARLPLGAVALLALVAAVAYGISARHAARRCGQPRVVLHGEELRAEDIVRAVFVLTARLDAGGDLVGG